MASTAKLLVEIVGDSSSAVTAFKKTEQASDGAKENAKKTSSTFGGIAKGVATGFAVAKVVDFGKKGSAGAAYESERAHDRPCVGIQGGRRRHGEGAEAAENYAGKLSAQTGIDDELIMNSGRVSSLRSIGGTGATRRTSRGIFDRATGSVSADLAAAGFGSIEE